MPLPPMAYGLYVWHDEAFTITASGAKSLYINNQNP